MKYARMNVTYVAGMLAKIDNYIDSIYVGFYQNKKTSFFRKSDAIS